MTRRPASSRGIPAAGIAAPSDRRYRRPDVRPDSRRFGRTATRIVRWAVVLAVGLVGLPWSARALLEAHLLTVADVVVSGNTRVSADAIEQIAGPMRGRNILQVDLEEHRRRVLDSPWVADAAFRRVLPATIEIAVVERSPLAVARLDQQLYLMDEAGVLIDEFRPEYGDLDLPVIDGLLTPADGEAPHVDPERAQLASRLLAALDGRPDLRTRLSQVDVTNAGDAVVMFDSGPTWLHLGHDRFVERLQTYLELVPTLRERFQDIDYVDLRFDARVFVRSSSRQNEVVEERR